MKDIEITTHLGCDVTLYDPNPNWVPSLGPGKMLSLRMADGRYVEVHLSPEDLTALFSAAKAEDMSAIFAAIRAEALEEAADAIQALHPGETKASVEFLRDRASAGSQSRPWQHEGHNPVQHRDRKAPWCNECGWSSPRPYIPAMYLRRSVS